MAVLRESPWYREILEEGLEKGLQQGLQQGLEQGLEQGLQQGLQQGLKQGMQRQLLRALGHRFGPVPGEVALRLQALEVEQLEALMDIALEVTSLDEFLSHLPPAREDGHGAESEPGGETPT